MFRDLALAFLAVALFGSTVSSVVSPSASLHLDTTLRALPESAPVEGVHLWSGAVSAGTLDSIQIAAAVDGPGPALAVFQVRWETPDGTPLCTVQLDCAAVAGDFASTSCDVALADHSPYRARAYSFCAGGVIPSGTATAVFFWE